jgi:hypothetical protein
MSIELPLLVVLPGVPIALFVNDFLDYLINHVQCLEVMTCRFAAISGGSRSAVESLIRRLCRSRQGNRSEAFSSRRGISSSPSPRSRLPRWAAACVQDFLGLRQHDSAEVHGAKLVLSRSGVQFSSAGYGAKRRRPSGVGVNQTMWRNHPFQVPRCGAKSCA